MKHLSRDEWKFSVERWKSWKSERGVAVPIQRGIAMATLLKHDLVVGGYILYTMWDKSFLYASRRFFHSLVDLYCPIWESVLFVYSRSGLSMATLLKHDLVVRDTFGICDCQFKIQFGINLFYMPFVGFSTA
jgi:hypothetical protein